MTDSGNIDRPILWGQLGATTSVRPTARNNPKVGLPSPGNQGKRLGGRFGDLDDAFNEQVTLTQSLGASDPQLVVVFEAVDERVDLERVAELLGLEILSDVEVDLDPDEEFPRLSVAQDKPVTGCLHAVCVSDTAKANLLAQWNAWTTTGTVKRGYAQLRDLFAHLKDVRAWGPQDRVRLTGDALEGMLEGEHEVEIELWHRKTPALRSKAVDEVSSLIVQSGGSVLSTAHVEQVGYLGIKCRVNTDLLRRLATGDYDAVSAVKSSHVMYFRAGAQSYNFSESSTGRDVPEFGVPSGEPVLCLLDGYPVANHKHLAGRVVVADPDDLASQSVGQEELRKHGTAMASVIVWGDLSEDSEPLGRPILARPILCPSPRTLDNVEELGEHELAPDLMRRVFRELFDGDGTTPPIAESVVVINLSVGDPAAAFDGAVSSWARTLDWLSAEYGVLVVVSAGNHGPLRVDDVAAIQALTGRDRADAVNAAVAATVPRRSLLAPADAINAVTVGCLNVDGAGAVPLGARFDAADGELIVSPLSALGSGHRRSVKPELLAPGGRTYFQSPFVPSTQLRPMMQGKLGPGIAVAAPDGYSDLFTTGTSPAAALVSRAAARAVDAVIDIAPRDLTRSEMAVAAKALVAHGARVPEGLVVHEDLGHAAHGYGVAGRELADGCGAHEATLLFVGDIGANESRTVSLPLPNGLQKTGIKRVTATLAWFTPVNWQHRQYRRAALDFSTPSGFTNMGSSLDTPAERAKRGTLQHGVWEISRAVQFGAGDTIDLKVSCKEQAGGLHGERVDFAVALTLWVAPELGVDVYAQVQQQVASRVPIAP